METTLKYTDSGTKEVENFISEQKRLLEKIIFDEKYIMGDDEIEVTGSDIIRIKNRLIVSINNKKKQKSTILILASYIYIVIGIGLTLFGLSYEYLKHLLESNKEQSLIILMGITIMAVGCLVLFYLKIKEKMIKEKEAINIPEDELIKIKGNTNTNI